MFLIKTLKQLPILLRVKNTDLQDLHLYPFFGRLQFPWKEKTVVIIISIGGMEVQLCKQPDLRATMLGSTNDTLCATYISPRLLLDSV